MFVGVREANHLILHHLTNPRSRRWHRSGLGDLRLGLLPGSRFLAFHAAVAEVVHMAGTAADLKKILREGKNMRVLSDDAAAEYVAGLLGVAQKYYRTLDGLGDNKNATLFSLKLASYIA